MDTEPFDASLRLAWRLRRARAWLEAADAETLVLPGEPFELPDFATSAARTFAFWEDASTFAQWQASTTNYGEMVLASLSDRPAITAAGAFRTLSGEDIVVPPWGKCVEGRVDENIVGLWIRLPAVPHLTPWRAPDTWGELAEALKVLKVDLFTLLQRLAPRIRDGARHYLLIGFAVPTRVGEVASQMFWQPVRLPKLSSTKRKGFRPSDKTAWFSDRLELFRDKTKVEWTRSENWSTKDLSGRGRLPNDLTALRTLTIGVGALGSMIAELLVRGGVAHMGVSDGDNLSGGNLLRHTLSLCDVGKVKSESIAGRLNGAVPHASVSYITKFPPQQPADIEIVQEADVVIDVTGSDYVLAAMEMFPWREGRLFLSISIGLRARRLFCFAADGNSFPHQDFIRLIRPWLERERGEAGSMEFEREGVGCWHPVFPARADDVWLMASAAVKWIEQQIATRPTEASLTVFEQLSEDGVFIGLRRINAERDNE